MYTDLLSWQERAAKRVVYTIGNFDGVHRGHQRLLAEVAALARECKALAAAVSFRAHTREFFKPEDRQTFAALTTRKERALLLEGLGLDAFVELDFNDALASLSGEDFLSLLAGENACGFVVGEGFRFAAQRSAGTEEIARYLAGHGGGRLVTVEPLYDGGAPVSSSRIRALLLAGDIAGANALLGREYSLSGVRKVGDSIASRLGYPSVNLDKIEALLPPNGVYAARFVCKEGSFPAMSYIGTRPTHRGREMRMETHVLDCALAFADGEKAEVMFVTRIRDEARFSDEAALLRQLARDKEAARLALLCGENSRRLASD